MAECAIAESSLLIAKRLCRIHPRGPPGRVNGCQQTHGKAGAADYENVFPLQLGWQVADEIDIRAQELMTQGAFQPGDKGADVECSENPERRSNDGSKDTYDRPLDNKDAHDAAW